MGNRLLFVAATMAASFAIEAKAEPKAVIEGPSKVSRDRRFVFSAAKSVGRTFWIVTDPRIDGAAVVVNGQKEYWGAAPPGSYRLVLVAFDDTGEAQTNHDFEVTDGANPTPPPNPGPGPNPNPGPTPPPNTFGLVDVSYRLAMAVPADSRGVAAELAKSFETTASLCQTLRDHDAIMTLTKKANTAALGPHKAAWQPWLLEIAKLLLELWRQGKIKDANDYRAAWLEIAAGLRKAQ